MLVWEKESLDKKSRKPPVKTLSTRWRKACPANCPRRRPRAVNDDLCNLYTFTDYHLGMLAWGEEGGDDWD
jgi:hypothetical protein